MFQICVKYILPKRKKKLFIFLPLHIQWSLSFNFTQIYFIKFSNEKILLNTILASQIQKHLFPTFIIPIFFKFCIQLNTNPMESTMVSKWNLSKNWIYFYVFLWKTIYFLTWYFFVNLFLYKIPWFHPKFVVCFHMFSLDRPMKNNKSMSRILMF